MGGFLSSEAQPEATRQDTSIRMVKVKLNRLSFEERQQVKNAFDRLQDAGLLPYWQFRSLIVGSHIPDFICLRLYEIFASQTVSQVVQELDESTKPQTELSCGMNLDDLMNFFSAFKNKMEYDQIAYWLLKWKITRQLFIQVMTGDCDSNNEVDNPYLLQHQDVSRYCKRFCKLGNPDLDAFYEVIRSRELNMTNETPLDEKVFRQNFIHLKDLNMFSWLFVMFRGYENKNLNFDDKPSANIDSRRLSVTTVERQKAVIENNTTLSSEELTLIQEFYDREIKSRPAKYVHIVFSRMFRQMSNETLKQKYFINSAISKSGTSSFEYLCRLVQVICKEYDDEELKISFLFEIFADHQPSLKRSQLKDFTDIFKIPISDFPQDRPVNFDDFIEICEEYDMAYNQFECCKPMLIAMIGITPKDDKEEKQAILAAVNENPNIESYILDNFTSEIEQFYVCEKKFWDQWQASIGFQEEGEAFGLRVEHKNLIENRSILEKRHNHRLKDHCQYLSDYVILPKFVFLPLSKWYGCDQILQRSIISYKSPMRLSSRGGIGHLQPMLQKQDSLRSSYSKNFKLSGQKFNSKRPDIIDDDYIQVKADIAFELEISPKVIYLAGVDQSGELLHAKLVQQNKVDFQLLKRVLKLDTLPFEELQLSRKTTFDWLLNYAAKRAKKNPKKGRILVDGIHLSGPKLYQSFEDFKLDSGTLIHYEFINDFNEWPSDLKTTAAAAGADPHQLPLSMPSVLSRRTAGLSNLGNTCYLNSAIQVLANLSQFYEYFVETKQYQQQVNTQAVMGCKGLLAMGFGTLMNNLWSGQSESFAPHMFKMIIGKCNDRFDSYEQQDSQEYLSYMIDSLHEELNLRLKKPYIVNPESKGRQQRSLALENWSNTLRREWSFVFHLFYGQMRSNLVCKTCSAESTTFDIYSNMPVPLPEPTQQTISVIIYRLPNKIKDVYNGKITKQSDGTYSLPSFDDNENQQQAFGGRLSSARNTGLLRSKTVNMAHQSQFTESYNYLTNDQPLRVHIKVEADIPIKTLIRKIVAIRETNLDPTQSKSQAVLFCVNPKTKFVRCVFRPEDKLTELDLLSQEIHCQEILTRKGKDLIRNYYNANSDFVTQHPEARLRTLMFPSARDELEKIAEVKKDEFPQLKHNTSSQSKYENQDSDSSRQENNIFGGSLHDTLVICYHRRFVGKENTYLSSYMPQLLQMPFVVSVPKNPSGRRLYDEVWTLAAGLVKHNSKLNKPTHRWWERRDWEKNIGAQSVFKPFVLKTVKMNGLNCSKCHWMVGCSGCMVQPYDAPLFLEDFGEDSTLVVEWHSETLQEHYNSMASEVVEHSSVNLELDDASIVNYTSLDDCLAKFHKPEVLENEMRCNKCNDLTAHIKKLEVYRPPPVLVITLKRFRQVGTIWRKVQTSVDFPVRNLDLSPFVTDLEFLNQQGIETKYNLHGLVNHFGTLSYGHYTSFVVNPFDKKWYNYDDKKCIPISEQHLSKESAYILFYVRKDIQYQPLEQIFPKLETTMFPGRPINTKDGKTGYVTKTDPGTKDVVEVQFNADVSKETSSLKVTDIAPETDSSVINLTEAETKHFERLHIKRQDSSSRDQTTRCCNLFPASYNQTKSSTLQQSQVVRKFDNKAHLRKLDKVNSNITTTSTTPVKESQTVVPKKAKTQDQSANISINSNSQNNQMVVKANTSKFSNAGKPDPTPDKAQLSQQASSVDLDHELTDQDMLQETTIAFKGGSTSINVGGNKRPNDNNP